MDRIVKLKQKTTALYQAKNSSRADWSDWLFENHIFLVSDEAEKLAIKFYANKDICIASAMLHDIADSVMSRFHPEHQNESLKIAEQFLVECDFTKGEINQIINDCIKLHSCHTPEDTPKTLEGKVVATADAVVHILSNFYRFATESRIKNDGVEKAVKWALSKIDRDFNNKILFSEIRDWIRPQYEKLKNELLKLQVDNEFKIQNNI
jgi:HD superfamily phosphodiesterase